MEFLGDFYRSNGASGEGNLPPQNGVRRWAIQDLRAQSRGNVYTSGSAPLVPRRESVMDRISCWPEVKLGEAMKFEPFDSVLKRRALVNLLETGGLKVFSTA